MEGPFLRYLEWITVTIAADRGLAPGRDAEGVNPPMCISEPARLPSRSATRKGYWWAGIWFVVSFF